MLPLLRDGVPGAKVVYTLSSVDELEGTTQREAWDLVEPRGDYIVARLS